MSKYFNALAEVGPFPFGLLGALGALVSVSIVIVVFVNGDGTAVLRAAVVQVYLILSSCCFLTHENNSRS